MRILTYSDLHLEFGSGWTIPREADGDLMVLAGDIVTLKDPGPLDRILATWKKPVLCVPGNHEYYTRRPMNEEDADFRRWLAANHPHARLLLDEGITINGVNFFGGTMWTDFDGGHRQAMERADSEMNDFRLICNPDGSRFRPADAIVRHEHFVAKLREWFATSMSGPRVVVSHHSPLINPRTKFRHSPLWPAFNSLDMAPLIKEYQPALWFYGHTHECDDQTVGSTRIISNQLGYPMPAGDFECKDFDPSGLPIDVNVARSST
jgi:predicted phosphodiesterase